MEVKIYQNFFLEEQKQHLDSAFIPYDNTKNEQPELREYPIFKKIFHELHKDSPDDLYWGLVSWRWKEKTSIEGKDYIKWIYDNPGYDLYHLNHHKLAAKDINCFVQGDKCHRGMLNYLKKLSNVIEIKFNFENKLEQKYFISSSHYVMNSKQWSQWLLFLEKCLDATRNHRELNQYVMATTKRYNNNVLNITFVIERLIVLYALLNDLSVASYIEYHTSTSDKHVPSVLRR